jgi:hypothetical protein
MLLLLPAPADTREQSELLFYEIEVSPEGSVTLAGFDAQNAKVAGAEIEPREGHGFYATVSMADRSVNVDAAISRGEGADVRVEGHVDGRAFAITKAGEETSVQSDATLDDAGIASVAHWARLADPLDVLAQALRARGARFDASSGETCGILLSSVVIRVANCALSVAAGPLVSAARCSFAAGQYSAYTEAC